MCIFILDWSQISKSTVNGRVQRWKYLTFLSFSRCWRQSGRAPGRGKGTCSDPGQIKRSYTNTQMHSRDTHKSLLHIHGALLTAAWCFIQHIYVLLTVLCPHVGGVFINSVFVVVCRSPESDKLRAGCLSWEGGRVAVETAMPKPDLLCLVQLLDGTIETFNVNVCNTHKHMPLPVPCRGDHKLLFANDRLVPTLLWVTNGTFLYFPIDLADSCSTACPWLEGLPHFLHLNWAYHT